jgi:hypothetical protein
MHLVYSEKLWELFIRDGHRGKVSPVSDRTLTAIASVGAIAHVGAIAYLCQQAVNRTLVTRHVRCTLQ